MSTSATSGRPRRRPRWVWPLAAALLFGLLPIAGLALPATLRIPPVRPRPEGMLPPALFSHRSHGGFRCYACHPSVFPQKLKGFAHAEMKEGLYCGHCHNGQRAPAIKEFATCESCHVPY